MELTETYQCPCRPGFIYASKQAIYQHKRSQRHKIWENRSKDDAIDATKRDNEILKLRTKLEDREQTIEKLSNKVIDLSIKNKKLTEQIKLQKKNNTDDNQPPLILF